MIKHLCLQICLCLSLQAASLTEALNELKNNQYGFVFAEVGITEEDLEIFSSVDIKRDRIFHQFGELETLSSEILDFFGEVGANEYEATLQVAARLTQIAHDVIRGSCRETAWVCLRSFIPTGKYDVPRWHMDGQYYNPDNANDLVFKFVLTLMGPSTLFYLLPSELRKTAEKHTRDRHYMKKFCKKEKTLSSKAGQGAVFIGGHGISALHSEPPIHENRLFLSIVPCMESDLALLKSRVLSVYPADSRASK